MNRLEREKENYNKVHKKINEIEYKQCSICKEWFKANLNNFYNNKSNKEGLSPYCKSCEKKKTDIYQNKHHEQKLASMRKFYLNPENHLKKQKALKTRKKELSDYRKAHPEKMKIYRENRKHKDHTITTKEWNDCKNYFINAEGEQVCAYCNLPMSKHIIKYNNKEMIGDFQKEHFNDDGANDLSNCIPSCKSCNCKKWNFKNWYSEGNPVFNIDRLNKIMKWTTEDYKKYIIIKPILPYKIKMVRNKKNKDKITNHFELWSLDENQELLEMKAMGDKKKDVSNLISIYFNIIL